MERWMEMLSQESFTTLYLLECGSHNIVRKAAPEKQKASKMSLV